MSIKKCGGKCVIFYLKTTKTMVNKQWLINVTVVTFISLLRYVSDCEHHVLRNVFFSPFFYVLLFQPRRLRSVQSVKYLIVKP